MQTNKSVIYFTQQSVNSIKLIEQNDFEGYQKLTHFLLTDLCFYPYQGQILLNKPSIDHDVEKLRLQLVARFSSLDVRNVHYQKWLIIYLNHHTTIYLLDLVSMTDESSGMFSSWIDQGFA